MYFCLDIYGHYVIFYSSTISNTTALFLIFQAMIFIFLFEIHYTEIWNVKYEWEKNVIKKSLRKALAIWLEFL